MARPRSEQAHRSAIQTTVEVLLESGVDGVTFDEISSRSGVAKSTLYRHFGSKEALIALAARGCIVEHPTPDTGNLEDDLLFLFGRYDEADQVKPLPQMLPMLIDAGTRDPKMQEVVDDVINERRRPIHTVIKLAQMRGEVSPDLDLDAAVATIVGPLTYRRIVERKEVTHEFRHQVLRGAVAALRSTADRTATPA
ncbi:TetR/AcrR family transcriptional regulator [Aquihabitans daechungensis]|uniref:TetR/AcrR family transcriptional regulator n=1 Tax=Aquihabitans daechungensis TaxID=1052257 RepID=UPI003BA2A22F